MASPGPETRWSRLSELVAQRIGLNFPRERWDDLKRCLVGAAQEFGFEDVSTFVDWLLSTSPNKAQLQILADHLTIGETYFFRDAPTLDALAQNVLPELIRARRGREQRLRIWSAACCTGEEPYSLAILLHQLLPDLPDWRVTITATDINARFLHKAAAGIYGEWSFRNAPVGLRERYFSRTEDGRYAIVPEIKNLVSFAHLNLVDDFYPSVTTDTNAMDVIFCRNVLMYFTPPQVAKVIGNLRRSLVEGGWLAVSPSEASQALFPRFRAANFPGVILFQKCDFARRPEPTLTASTFAPELAVLSIEAASSSVHAAASQTEWQADAPPEAPIPDEAVRDPLVGAQSLYQAGHYSEAADVLLAALAERPGKPMEFSLLAHALANHGQLAEALSWCDRWVAADKLDPAAHYLRAVVQLEQGDPAQALRSLQRAVYLRPDFVLAHFALGNLARGQGKPGEADRHFGNALRLLARHQADDVLPESDGLSVGRLQETIIALSALELVR